MPQITKSGVTTNNIKHAHEYEVDDNGNGWAHYVQHHTKPAVQHRHKIINWVVKSGFSECYPHCYSIHGVNGAGPHIHSLPQYGRGGVTKRYSAGGMLVGPTHEQGGIPVIVDGIEPIEVEGGEFIINAQTTAALGETFLHKLNSTSTSHHSGGFNQGDLPSPSNYKKGGKFINKHKRRTKPIVKNRYYNKKKAIGGKVQIPGKCGLGGMLAADGTCISAGQ